MGPSPIALAAGQRSAGPFEVGTAPRAADRTFAAAKLAGLAIVMVVPAIFWTFVAWVAGQVVGIEIGTATLWLVASLIAVFLGLVCSAMIAQH